MGGDVGMTSCSPYGNEARIQELGIQEEAPETRKKGVLEAGRA